MSKELLIAFAVLALPFAIMLLKRWQRGFMLCFLYLPISGIPILYSGNSGIMLLFKDLFLLLPSYLSYFLAAKNRTRYYGFPKFLVPIILIWFLLGIAQMFNPGSINFVVGFIGLKVWFFYIPLMFLSYSYATDIKKLTHLMRILVVLMWIPCVVGLIQYIGSSLIGFERTITMFYGANAQRATQNFGEFNYGGGFFRIPSTFSFNAQYNLYLQASVFVAYMYTCIEKSRKWKLFSKLTLGLVVVATFFSGSRGNFLYMPILLSAVYALHLGIKGGIKLLLFMLIAGSIFTTVSGIDISFMFNEVAGLTTHNAEHLAGGQILNALWEFPLGRGTGTNTIGARHAFPSDSSALGQLNFYENYYAKACVEFGFFGPLLALSLHLTNMFTAFQCYRYLNRKQFAGITSAMIVFFTFILVLSTKGTPLDQDPMNCYYWLIAGWCYRLNSLRMIEGQEMHFHQVTIHHEAVTHHKSPSVSSFPSKE